jgi:PAS domain S-box-containing protein
MASQQMAEYSSTPDDQETAEADVEEFRDQLGPFVVAAEKTRMAMLFTNAKKADNRIVFANEAFLALTGFARQEVLGVSFMALMTRGTGSEAMAEIEAAFAGRADSDPEICFQRKNGSDFWASLFISPVCDETGKIEQHFISLVDQSGHREKQAHFEMLIDELNHRVKNTLSTVQSIVRQSLRSNTDPTAIRESIESRIFALSRSHDLLSNQNWEGVGLGTLIDAALKPFVVNGDASRIAVDGPNIRLSPKATLALGIAFHELATNAVKYGAFSNDVGKIRIAWTTETQPAGERLMLTWREMDGPVVIPPTKKGFGSQVIERGLAHELEGKVNLAYLPGGVECTIDVLVPRKIANE